MRGVTVPDRDEDFTADPVELFFDLVFVFAFSRLVYHLVDHPDWTGVACGSRNHETAIDQPIRLLSGRADRSRSHSVPYRGP